MSKWTLFPADTDQATVEIEDYAGVIGVTVGDITAELDPAEARHMAGALLTAANAVEMEGVGPDEIVDSPHLSQREKESALVGWLFAKVGRPDEATQ